MFCCNYLDTLAKKMIFSVSPDLRRAFMAWSLELRFFSHNLKKIAKSIYFISIKQPLSPVSCLGPLLGGEVVVALAVADAGNLEKINAHMHYFP